MKSVLVRVEALAAADAAGTFVSPACLLMECAPDRPARVVAVDSPAQLAAHPDYAASPAISLPDSVLLPGLVNAHCHLDLTLVGPRPFDAAAGFVGWIDMIRRSRTAREGEIARAVRRGVELSLEAGTVAVGDILGFAGGWPGARAEAWGTLRTSPLGGRGFLEFFAIGPRARAASEAMDRDVRLLPPGTERMRLGVQPHAPYSVSPDGYVRAAEIAAALGLDLATHLAESSEEHEFVARGTGPLRTFLDSMGLMDEPTEAGFVMGRTPTEHLESVLPGLPLLLAHVNDASEADLERLGRGRARVVYCPRASAYFGHARSLGRHRYREMRGAGVTVALGTDSIVNLPRPATESGSGGFGVLAEMRWLFARDGTDPMELLHMGTMSGAAALGLDPSLFILSPGHGLAGLLSVRVSEPIGGHAFPNVQGAMSAVLKSDQPPRLLFCWNGYDLAARAMTIG
ncbi:MAG: amidohydrolase family protein [Phycisphaerae bacterium]|nr:amidohydrolase family protein [Phycisphaerae bacterium]